MADEELDSLELKIKATATQANNAIDRLVKNLGNLATSLGTVGNANFNGFATGVKNIVSAMQGMKSVGTADFTRISKGVEKISRIDVTSINKASTAMTYLGKAFNNLETTDKAAEQITKLADGIKQLGYKSSINAVQNIPKLATAMKELMQELSKAPRVSQNIIDMTNALAQLSRTGASSGRAASSLKTSLFDVSTSAGAASKSSWSLASAFGKLYASYWLLFRGINKLGDAINIASSLTEVENVVRTTFGQYESLVDDMAKTSIQDFGMSELSVKQFASRFQAMGTAMGISSEQVVKGANLINDKLSKTENTAYSATNSVADMSMNLTKLTADMASFYDIDQSDVARNLQAIFTGETEPLRKYGLDLTQATLKEWALKQGLDADIQSMSQAEKTMLRYQYVMANTTAAQGDFARTADTWHNQTVILKQSFQQLAGIIGTSLINSLKPFVNGLNFVMGKVISFAETVTNALGHIFGWKFEVTDKGITDDWSNIADSVGDVADDTGAAADNTAQAAKNIEKMNKGARQFDELKLITTPDDSDSGSNKKGTGGKGTNSGGVGNASDGNLVQVDTIFKDYESQINSLYELGEYIGNVLTNAMNDIDWDKVYAGARNFGTGLADFLNGLISPELFGAVGRTVAGALNTAIYAALAFGERFDWEDFGLSIATGINEFFATFDFKSLAKAINVWVQGIYNTIKTAIKNIRWSKVFDGISELIGDIELKTVAIIIGAILLKKYFKLEIAKNILKAIATKISQSLAKSLAAKMGVELAENAGLKDAIASGINKMFSKIDYNVSAQSFTSKFAIALKSAIGIAGFASEALLIYDAFHKIGEGAEFTVGTLAEVASGAGIALGALKLIGLLNPWTAAAVGAVGLTAAISGIITGTDDLTYKSSLLSESVKEAADNLNKTVESSKEQINSIGDTYAGVRTIADKYFELADNFDNLTEAQKEMLVTYADYLVEQCPELAESIDTVTGQFVGQKDEVYKTIDALEAYAKAAAMEDVLKELYKQEFNIGNQLKDNNEKYNNAKNIIYDYAKELTGMSEEAFNTEYEIGNLGDAFDVLSELLNKTKERSNGFTKTSSDLRKEVGLNSQEVWQLANDNKQLNESYQQCEQSIANAAETAAVCKNEYNRLSDKQDDTRQSANELAQAYENDNERMSKSTQESFAKIENNISEKTAESKGDIEDFFNNASNTFNRLEEVGVNGGTKLSGAFKTSTSGLPDYNSELFNKMHLNAVAEAIKAGAESGSSLVSSYKDNIDGVPNTTAVAFLSIIDAVNAGGIGADAGAELMNNLKSTIDSNAWKIHESLTNAISSSYTAEIEGETYSTGNPMSTGFMKLRFKGFEGFADGGYPQKYSLFMAGENGIPEMAGTIGGKTAVAGGSEITGIREAVYDTSQQEVALLRQQNELLQGILNKKFGISQNEIGNSARKYAKEYFQRTGRPAFDY